MFPAQLSGCNTHPLKGVVSSGFRLEKGAASGSHVLPSPVMKSSSGHRSWAWKLSIRWGFTAVISLFHICLKSLYSYVQNKYMGKNGLSHVPNFTSIQRPPFCILNWLELNVGGPGELIITKNVGWMDHLWQKQFPLKVNKHIFLPQTY